MQRAAAAMRGHAKVDPSTMPIQFTLSGFTKEYLLPLLLVKTKKLITVTYIAPPPPLPPRLITLKSVHDGMCARIARTQNHKHMQVTHTKKTYHKHESCKHFSKELSSMNNTD